MRAGADPSRTFPCEIVLSCRGIARMIRDSVTMSPLPPGLGVGINRSEKSFIGLPPRPRTVLARSASDQCQLPSPEALYSAQPVNIVSARAMIATPESVGMLT